MNVGTPHTLWSLAAASCSACTVAMGRPPSISDSTASASTPCSSSTAAHLGLVAQAAAVVVAEREERLVGVEEPVGELVAHDHAGLQGEQPGVVLPAAPDVGLALGHVHLPERERHEGHVPRRAGSQPLEHVLVGVAGERAAVVPGHGEGAAVGHAPPNDRRAPWHSDACYGFGHTRRAMAASPMPMAAPATTSEAWCIFT